MRVLLKKCGEVSAMANCIEKAWPPWWGLPFVEQNLCGSKQNELSWASCRLQRHLWRIHTWRWLLTWSFVSPSTCIMARICLGVATGRPKSQKIIIIIKRDSQPKKKKEKKNLKFVFSFCFYYGVAQPETCIFSRLSRVKRGKEMHKLQYQEAKSQKDFSDAWFSRGDKIMICYLQGHQESPWRPWI